MSWLSLLWERALRARVRAWLRSEALLAMLMTRREVRDLIARLPEEMRAECEDRLRVMLQDILDSLAEVLP